MHTKACMSHVYNKTHFGGHTIVWVRGILGSWCPLLWCVEWGIQDKMAEDVQSLQGLEEWLKQCAIYYVKNYVSEHSHKVSPVKNSA